MKRAAASHLALQSPAAPFASCTAADVVAIVVVVAAVVVLVVFVVADLVVAVAVVAGQQSLQGQTLEVRRDPLLVMKVRSPSEQEGETHSVNI
jgi:hypothetical protein